MSVAEAALLTDDVGEHLPEDVSDLDEPELVESMLNRFPRSKLTGFLRILEPLGPLL